MKGDYRMLSSKQKKCIELMARGELTHTKKKIAEQIDVSEKTGRTTRGEMI